MAYDRAYEEGQEDMPHRVNISNISNLTGYRPAKHLGSILDGGIGTRVEGA